jgi:hypothetical protein
MHTAVRLGAGHAVRPEQQQKSALLMQYKVPDPGGTRNLYYCITPRQPFPPLALTFACPNVNHPNQGTSYSSMMHYVLHSIKYTYIFG